MVTKKQARAGVKAKAGMAGVKVIPLLGIEPTEKKATEAATELYFDHKIDTYVIPGKSKVTVKKGQRIYGLEPVSPKDALKAMSVRRKQLRQSK